MLGEFFIDTCLTTCCSLDGKVPESKSIFESMYYVLNWYRRETNNGDVPIEFMDKLDVAIYLSNYRLNTPIFEFERMVTSLSSGKAKNMIPMLEGRRMELNSDDVSQTKKIILDKKKICDLIVGKNKLEELLQDIDSGNFIDDEEIIERWEHEISRNWTKLSEVHREMSINEVSSLNLLEDDYTAVMEKLRDAYNPKNSIQTGYPSVDNLLPSKGFEQRRFYVIGGTSGVGKSNFIVNLMRNAVEKVENEEGDTYLLITGENSIQESLERLYGCFTGIPHIEVVQKIVIDQEFSLEPELKKILKHFKANIEIRYIKPNVTTTSDVRNIIEDVRSRCNLKVVYLDYLDLVQSSLRIPDLRLDLGQSCVEMKGIAVEFDLPFITATQLNRSGYDIELAPTLVSMSESMKKVDNADFILFLQPAAEPILTLPNGGIEKICQKIKMTVLKNRNGDTGESTHLMVAKKAGGHKIFNYRIEEMPKMQDHDNPVTNDHINPDITDWDRI
ncbi:MAG: hypothetical protein KAS32_00570 [Candidatus Peribacteraceae bacterium]|nr:hypothetical protein [Candidatus Peribacteraceae bacterium]